MIREILCITLCTVIQMATLFWSVTFGIVNFWWRPYSAENSSFTTKTSKNSTIDSEEFAKFSEQERDWWGNPKGHLHTMNSLRVPLIRDAILHGSGATAKKALPLEGYKIIDVGAGGGILAEPIARLGAQVTGVDPASAAIEVAKKHASQDKEVTSRLNYVCDTIENLILVSPGKFDAVVCSEVVEHVADVPAFVSCCVKLAREGGSLIFTTWNRTTLSYFEGIWSNEYILKVIPQGTHNWNKFVKPSELAEILENLNCKVISVKGMQYHPLSKTWSWSKNPSAVYGLHAIKL